MARIDISCTTARWVLFLLPVLAGAQVAGQAPGTSENGILSVRPPVYGAESCSTSGCHGGAAEQSFQHAAWSQRDAHSKSHATLTTARSARMAEALGIADPAASQRCATCHAPLQNVDRTLLVPEARVTEGVSCVSCHGGGEQWLRSHPRKDYSHADRVAAGMRDLRDLYGRANACVACHQNIEPELVSIGRHPELIFELDGQTQAQPPHWRKRAGGGAQAWFVGQAVALREVSWALEQQTASAERETARWEALRWLLARAVPEGPDWLETGALNGNHAAVRAAADRLMQAFRADRLVLALDRLLAARPREQRSAAASAQLDVLFKLAQSQPDFSPDHFSRALAEFEKALRQ